MNDIPSNQQGFLNKIRDAFYGVSVWDDWPDTQKMLRVKEIVSPPSYLVKLALEISFEQKLSSFSEKSSWAIPLFFKDNVWFVSDWKRYKWNIYSFQQNTSNIVEKLVKKIESACKILDKEISKFAKIEFKNESFILQNFFFKTEQLFSFFINQIHDAESEFEKYKSKQTPEEKFDSRGMPNIAYLSGKIRENCKRIEANFIAATIFFFAHTEAILDACFALGDRKNYSYKKFRELSWGERVKFFIRIDKKTDGIFSDLTKLRELYRNIPVHASPVYFFGVKDFGFIPATYEKLSNPHLSPILGGKTLEVERNCKLLDEFIAILKTNKNTCMAYKYVSSGLPVPIEKSAVDKLRKHMESVEDFETEIQTRLELQERFENMDI